MTKPNVLVVDDDAAMCSLLATRLGSRGFTIHTSTDPAKALALIEGDLDAVVTDINMKGMSGLELCRRLHELRPGLPVLVITAFGSLESAIAMLAALMPSPKHTSG